MCTFRDLFVVLRDLVHNEGKKKKKERKNRKTTFFNSEYYLFFTLAGSHCTLSRLPGSPETFLGHISENRFGIRVVPSLE